MKDRTLIVLAVLFLLLTVGSGVNTSLEAGNRIMGKPMAPGIKEVYHQKAPVVLGRVREIGEAGKKKTRQVYEEYPVVIKKFNRVTARVGGEIKSKTEPWRTRFFNAVNRLKDKPQSKKSALGQ